jgi:radical SAM protein with 4Fe4S-binding SPASM domain
MNINTKCNNACIWCYDKASRKNEVDMSMQTFNKILYLLKGCGCNQIAFFGGEPTLHPQLSKFVSKATIENFYSVIVSNGAGYSESFLDEIEEFKNRVTLNISIEGSCAKIHDDITKRRGSFTTLKHNISLALQKRFKVVALTTLCRTNADNLSQISELLADMGIGDWLINFASYPLNVSYVEEDYLSISEFSEIIASSITPQIFDRLKISVGPPLPQCMLSPSFKQMGSQLQLKRSCQLLSSDSISIDASGNILPCLHLAGVVMGNINNFDSIDCFKTFLSAIDNEVRIPMCKYPKIECNECEENKECFGGCPLLGMETN